MQKINIVPSTSSRLYFKAYAVVRYSIKMIRKWWKHSRTCFICSIWQKWIHFIYVFHKKIILFDGKFTNQKLRSLLVFFLFKFIHQLQNFLPFISDDRYIRHLSSESPAINSKAWKIAILPFGQDTDNTEEMKLNRRQLSHRSSWQVQLDRPDRRYWYPLVVNQVVQDWIQWNHEFYS